MCAHASGARVCDTCAGVGGPWSRQPRPQPPGRGLQEAVAVLVGQAASPQMGSHPPCVPGGPRTGLEPRPSRVQGGLGPMRPPSGPLEESSPSGESHWGAGQCQSEVGLLFGGAQPAPRLQGHSCPGRCLCGHGLTFRKPEARGQVSPELRPPVKDREDAAAQLCWQTRPPVGTTASSGHHCVLRSPYMASRAALSHGGQQGEPVGSSEPRVAPAGPSAGRDPDETCPGVRLASGQRGTWSRGPRGHAQL